jgi:hypothetical protein
MSLVIDPKITFTGQEAREGILEPAFVRPEVARIRDVRQNLKADEKIAFLGRIDKVTRIDGGAGTGKQSRKLAMSEKTWSPKKMKIWVSLNEDDLEDTFYVYLTKNGVDRRNIEQVNEFYQQWVLEVFSDAARSDAMRIAFLGDTAAAKVADGGKLTDSDAVNVADYNQIDGFWKQLFAAVTATKTKRVTIAKNAEATYALQLALGSTDAYDTYRKMINIADPRLRAASDKVFLVTETLFQNRIDQKESLSPGLESMYKRQDQTYNDDQYRGIPIISMDAVWDRYIQADFDNGTKYDLPHRAILTTVSNLVAGFDDDGGVDDFRTYFDEESETVNFKGLYKFDAKVLQEYMSVVAY